MEKPQINVLFHASTKYLKTFFFIGIKSFLGEKMNINNKKNSIIGIEKTCENHLLY